MSQLVAYAIGTLWSFFWNRRFTFGSCGPVRRQLARFVILQASLAVISGWLIQMLIEVSNFRPVLSWLSVMSIITVVNFELCRRWALK
jgi:putative flippase GtrA